MIDASIFYKCDRMVRALVGSNLSDKWWHSCNKAFDNKTPFDTFCDSPDTVYNYLLRFCI